MEDVGTLESFLTAVSPSPVVQNPVLMKSFFSATGSGASTPNPQSSPTKKITMAQRFGIKLSEYGFFTPTDKETQGFPSSARKKHNKSIASDGLPIETPRIQTVNNKYRTVKSKVTER
jgi:hypothetical protein